MEIGFRKEVLDKVEADWLVVPVPLDFATNPESKYSQDIIDGLISEIIELGDFETTSGETAIILTPAGVAAKRVLLIGLEIPRETGKGKIDDAVMTALRSISKKDTECVAVALPPTATGSESITEFVEAVGYAAVVASVGQDLYQEKISRRPFQTLSIIVHETVDEKELSEAVDSGRITGECTNLVRELVNRAAHEIYPVSVADRSTQLATQYGLEIEIFDETRLRAERMNSMLAVAQGSSQPPRMVILKYTGAPESESHTALVGKGVTFDSGGLSLKPSDSMKTMKADMAGSATVLGTIVAAARLKLPVNLRAYLGLVENMVSGSSYKLGDVLTARNGVTIEVHNTDAEGRLVLADVLTYAAEQKPAQMIDLATLTGACVVALGEDYTGAFTNDDDLCGRLESAAAAVGELLWKMPMDASFSEQLKSDVADCKNIGTRWGGAITAAKFLEKFVNNLPWVHLDIAGPSFASSNKPHREGGATGVMLKTLIEFLSAGK